MSQGASLSSGAFKEATYKTVYKRVQKCLRMLEILNMGKFYGNEL
ncbi:hypothetical protein CG394_03690 [Gardnerella vaginalis]|uniref:Uncharacterized protein n=2 Tax=Gardnerella vaginalis TaxID=2702 RepID=A0A2I1KP16_GARVA|nr:hypothetical protein HMPREF0421_20162 [Gardnerella vaginalis ATCC 14019]AYZ21287.1 hypothetical protein EGX90_01605 [Gardnerella vaginalis]EPI53881.1 hypothetical protein HMPREF1575_00097 [Gardnerella vaginalis JCP7672]EPI57435.1 hypothetical protein HMPREF1573_00253 [Gardnerella vaginalis JCP7276]TCH82839.1 hypothetical protein E0E46_02095 [Gardnerella vaginalis ATCC 14018 = JCM 11026]